MIKVTRGPAPKGFQDRAKQWARRFRKARRGKPPLSASKFWAQVRREISSDALELCRRFHDKCAFCESQMKAVSNPHIEHYRPKSRTEFAHLMFNWDNWLISCGRCNENKWTKFPEVNGQPALLDPTAEDPAKHLDFHGAFIVSLSDRGEITIRLLGLDRNPLHKERGQWLVYINLLLLLCCCHADENIRNECRQHLIWAMQEDAPYSGMTKAYLSIKTPKLANPERPHARVRGEDRLYRIVLIAERYSEEIRGMH